MSIPLDQLPSLCSIHRPFGTSEAIETDLACRIAPDLIGRATDGYGALQWTHRLIIDEGVDLRDNCDRLDGVNLLVFHDGDEVRIPPLTGERYVVVWVEVVALDTPQEFQRAYLMRHR
jgi:hypothetical protein